MSLLVADHLWGVITIWQEAAGESLDGKTAVAEVILRRTADKFMSDGTVAGTCLQAMQFSCWNAMDVSKPNKRRVLSCQLDDTDQVVKDCMTAWDNAIGGSNLTKGAVFYYNDRIVTTPPTWANPDTFTIAIGQHSFYSA